MAEAVCPPGVLEGLPTEPRAAMQVLQGCALPDDWKRHLERRRLGMRGDEALLCRKARKLLDAMDRLADVAKKCGAEDWDASRASGPRALVVGHALSGLLEDRGIDPVVARRAGEIVAGMHGATPSWGSYRHHSAVPVVSHGHAPLGVPVILEGSADAVSLLEQGGPLLAFPPGERLEDTPVYGLSFLVRERTVAAARVRALPDGFEIQFGEGGDVHQVPTAAAAVNQVRRWLDWSQEYGRIVMPDRIWLHPDGTVQQLAELLAACSDPVGGDRFTEVVVAADGELLPWSPTVDAVGL